jgi:hypothetical protein
MALRDIGSRTMSSTTPMRKSKRMKRQPMSARPRYIAFRSANATANPQKAASSAMPVTGSHARAEEPPSRRAQVSPGGCDEALE